MPILMLLSNRYVQLALVVSIALMALWGYGKHQHSLGYSQAQGERYVADLESFKSESHKLQGLSVVIEGQIAEFRAIEPKVIERYTNVVVEKPLPANCIVDPERLRSINAAIASANSGQLGKSMPSGK
jgi:hypothetical protein